MEANIRKWAETAHTRQVSNSKLRKMEANPNGNASVRHAFQIVTVTRRKVAGMDVAS
jgi:hypothetical protein